MLKKLLIFSFTTMLMLLEMSTALAAEEIIINGAEVVNNNCGRCHNSRSIDEFSIEEWSVIIPHMRRRAHLTGKESNAVIDFFQNMKEVTTVNTLNSPIEVNTGDEILAKYSCLGCHSFDGEGSTVAPNLDNIFSIRSEEFFRRKLINPKLNNSASPMPSFNINESELGILISHLKNEDV